MGEEAGILAQHGTQLTFNNRQGPVSWTDCEDLEVFDDAGHLLFAGPRYFRCARAECRLLVTHGMVAQGGCWCGNRRLAVALRLTLEEKGLLKRGYYALIPWEVEQIHPTLPAQQHETGWGQKEWQKRYA